LQVLLDHVRRAIRQARRKTSSEDVDRKLSTIRAAACHAFPAPDIHQMNEEIEQGYREAREP
jgi:hypothetical protein